ncbi:MAG: mannitol dehydrogenase family protein [Pseudomonadota bacterium]
MRQSPPPGAGIVHLGLGAFFRAHGALIVEDAVRAAGGDWGIIGVSLRAPAIRDQLVPQDCAYTAVEMSPTGRTPRVVNVLRDVIFAPEDPQALVDRMADPAIRIVSLTVTEKGYCHVPSTGALDREHPDIQSDIANPLPVTAVGCIVRALQKRQAAGLRPFTVLSCDNLPDNGRVARNVVVGLARCIDPTLADWIAYQGRFPSTMVDRIVPATRPEDITALAAATGRQDRAPVFHEPFCQWVIEDSFVDGARPALERVAGVQLVDDVAPFEAMKIRMLNGTHSALAYLGYLAGHHTISGTVADDVLRTFVQSLWRREIIPTITPPDGVDLQAYAHDLLARYANPAIQHRTWQIAMDGSQKLPQRLLGAIGDNMAAGRACDGLILTVAAWMRYVGGVDEQGAAIDVRDPLAARLRALSDAGETPQQKVENLLSVEEVFAPALAAQMREPLVQAFGGLVAQGARDSVRRVSEG